MYHIIDINTTMFFVLIRKANCVYMLYPFPFTPENAAVSRCHNTGMRHQQNGLYYDT